MNDAGCECDYRGAGCRIHPTTNPDGWGPDPDNDPELSDTGMDGYDGPTHIRIGGRLNSKYSQCKRHNHWYDPAKYDQCWYCWRDTNKTIERKLKAIEYQRGGKRPPR